MFYFQGCPATAIKNLISAANVHLFWDAAPCSLAEIDRRFRGANCLHYKTFMMEAVSSYQTTRHSISEENHLYTRRSESA
jgi:hypothetical protein